jgi:hypothetical protein
MNGIDFLLMFKRLNIRHFFFKSWAAATTLIALGITIWLLFGRGASLSTASPLRPSENRADPLEKVDFTFHVRPILSDRCFACHGPDKTKVKSGLQLNRFESAVMNLAQADEPNRYALIPGDPDNSQLWKRISAVDRDYRMPPASSTKKPLTDREKDTIRRWIAQGAEYKEHWAFVPPVKQPLPKVSNQAWVRNELDAFILARLEQRGMAPSPPADDETLIRRLSFDLTGLPPSLKQIDAYLQDTQPDRDELLIELLLASDHYGERLAVEWLDAARYADTNAIHVDMPRTSWPWRDWVIRAFNENKPYDKFIIEQLAGDLLPEATLDQKIATSFNRHHPINNETGAISEEFLIEYAADRVQTVGTVFLGLTVGCARCHDHKFDPVTMDDYYSLMSFFNSIDESGVEILDEYIAVAYQPYVEVWSPQDKTEYEQNARRLEEIKTQSDWTDEFSRILDEAATPGPLQWAYLIPEGKTAQTHKKDDPNKPTWEISVANRMDVRERFRDPKVTQSESFFFNMPRNPNGPGPVNLVRIEVPELHSIKDLGLAYAFVPSWLRTLNIELVDNRESKNARRLGVTWSWAPDWNADSDSGYLNALDSDPNSLWEVAPTDRAFTMFLLLDEPLQASDPNTLIKITLDFMKGGTHFPQKANVLVASLPNASDRIKALSPYSPLALIPQADLTDWQKRSLVLDWNKSRGLFPLNRQQEGWRMQDRQYALKRNVVRCMVMKEKASPHPTFVLRRGQYTQPDKERPRGRSIPAVFGTLPDDAPKDRLGLAQWLVSPQNPMTARVVVNRFWQMIFGVGLVKTAEDFGFQGEIPSHPDLLDFLAVDFKENGWNVKRLLRQIVSSATYRQRSQ